MSRLTIDAALAAVGITEPTGRLCGPEDEPTLWAAQAHDGDRGAFLAERGLRPLEGVWNFAMLADHARDTERAGWRADDRAEREAIRDAADARAWG